MTSDGLGVYRTLAFVAAIVILDTATSLAKVERPGKLGVLRRKQLQLSPGHADCRNGWELFKSLANQNIEHIHILNDIEIYDADWSSTQAPLAILRNLTLEGANSNRDQWLILDMNFVASKVQLGAGIRVTFTHLVLVNGKAGPNFQSPGIDLFVAAPSPPPPAAAAVAASGSIAMGSMNGSAAAVCWPGILLEDVAVVHRTCLPMSGIRQYAGRFPRPAIFPGNQTSSFGLSQDGCVDSCAARPLVRCWPMRGLYEDWATMAYTAVGIDGVPKEAGYTVQLQRADVICATVMDDACVARANSYIGCFNSMFPPNSTAAALAGGPMPCSRDAGSGDGGGSGGMPLCAILGGVLGGTAFVAVVAAVVFVAWRAGGWGWGAQQSKERLAGDGEQGSQQHATASGSGGPAGPRQQPTEAEMMGARASAETVMGGEEWQSGDDDGVLVDLEEGRR